MKLGKALNSLKPGALWIVRGETYEDIEWKDEVQTKPTKKQVQDELARLDGLAYQEQRRPEYPPIGDQLDALWKGGDAAAEMLAKIEAVKNKYPKPE
jgi:hypothetical protein